MLDRYQFAAAAADKVKTVKYSQLDCQSFVEWCAKKAGYTFNARGSNDIFRNYTKAKNKTTLFNPTIGDVVFKWREESEKLPSRYRGDGIGDMYHIGIITAATDGKYTVCHSANSRENGKVDNYSSLSALGKVWAYAATLKNTVEIVEIEDEPEEEEPVEEQVVEEQVTAADSPEWAQNVQMYPDLEPYYISIDEQFQIVYEALEKLKEIFYNS